MNVLFWIGVTTTLVAPIVIGLTFEDPSTSWVAALCGAFITFISKFEAISELSMGPVRAKMKETIQEATATIEQLRKVASVTSEATLTDLMAGYFSGGMNLEKRLELHDKVIASLKQINATPEQIKETENDWRKGICLIYHRAINKIIEVRKNPHQVNFDAPEDNKKAGKEIHDLLDFSAVS